MPNKINIFALKLIVCLLFFVFVFSMLQITNVVYEYRKKGDIERVEQYIKRCERCNNTPLSIVSKNLIRFDVMNDSVKVGFMNDTTFCQRVYAKGDTNLVLILLHNQYK